MKRFWKRRNPFNGMSKRLNSDPNLNFRIQRSCPHSCFFSLSKEGPMETIPWLDRLIFSTNIRVIFPL